MNISRALRFDGDLTGLGLKKERISGERTPHYKSDGSVGFWVGTFSWKGSHVFEAGQQYHLDYVAPPSPDHNIHIVSVGPSAPYEVEFRTK